MTVVCDPRLAEDLPAEALLEPLVPGVPGVAPERRARVELEGVGGRAHADDRLAGAHVPVDPGHLLIWKVAESGRDDHQVRVGECLQAGNVAAVLRIDGARGRVDGEQLFAS
jgi:hypothetical protein